MQNLTERQLEVIRLIYEGQKRGNTPTLSELAGALGVSSRQTVKDHLDAIARKGWLRREPRRPRAIILKPSVISELERKGEFRENLQQTLGLTYNQSSSAPTFSWSNSTNIFINEGVPSNALEQTLIDSSSIISLSENSANGFDPYMSFQLVTERSNFDRLYNTTSRMLVATHNPLIVSPTPIPVIDSNTGYLLIEGENLYQVIWSGLSSRHYYALGKEYGTTTNISIVDCVSGQAKLFSQAMDSTGISTILSDLGRRLRSWSQYVDFPIYGAALKQSGEVIFWSHKTGRDINDLRYFFLADIMGTNIISHDRVLLRDVSCNLLNLSRNSTS